MGILAKLSQKCSKLGLFVEFYNFPKKKCPKFSFFFRKIPVFHYFFFVFLWNVTIFPPQKKAQILLFPCKSPVFHYFFWCFCEMLLYFPQKRPKSYFFSRKSPVFHYFCWSHISKTLAVRGMRGTFLFLLLLAEKSFWLIEFFLVRLGLYLDINRTPVLQVSSTFPQFILLLVLLESWYLIDTSRGSYLIFLVQLEFESK